MQKGAWKKRINSQLENLGTYSPEYSVAIDSLADALAQYDSTMKQWRDSSKANGFKTLQMVVEYTNKAGATNLSRSPYYIITVQLRDQIIKYCKELGLSPTSLSKTTEVSGKKGDELDEFMSRFK